VLTLKFFASCADEVGERQKIVEFYPSPRSALESVPELRPLRGQPHLRVAVNRAWAEWDTPLKDGDEVAFLPPVSGG
jgi:sulfur-carrier protein